jgi:uncharacterized protein (TIGR02001 family)
MTDSRFPCAATDQRGRPARLRRRDGAIDSGSFGRTLFAFALAIGSAFPLALQAQSTTFNGTVALSSQLVDRGQAITGDTPVLQGAAAWTFPSGWSLGVSASATARSSGRLAEALAQVSHRWLLSGDWQLQASLLYYRYPGSTRYGASDRTETGLNWTYRDVLTLGVSAIYVLGPDGHRPRGAADVNLHWPLAGRFSLSLGAGVAQPFGRSYRYYYRHGYRRRYGQPRTGLDSYGHLGLVWVNGPWRIELDRIVADPATRRQRDYLGASPWVATLSRSF